MKETALFLACLSPFLRLVWLSAHAGLGVNPVEFVTHATGDWALNFFCLTLAVSPLVRLTGWSWWAKRRRMLGLFVFFYAALHFTIFLVLDLELAFADLGKEVARRPYICVGFASLVILFALAATSTDRAIRTLGRWWGRLHKFVYLAAILGVTHYYLLVKSDTRLPLRYGAVIALLLAVRIAFFAQAWTRAKASA